MDQASTPIIDAIEQFSERRRPYFCIPAHRFDAGVDEKAAALLGPAVFSADLTEADGLDDLHHPEGAILSAQELAADFFGAGRCWFLVNGTTCGNEAMILAAVKPGEKILAARNCHKSVLAGLVLSGAVPVWILPEYLDDWNIFGGVRPETVEEALCADPEIRAVILTSPTYYGICSDIESIAGICRSHGIPLLVDEAHGGHFYFGDTLLPRGAVAQGADAAAVSMHKTGGSMTQSSLLLCRKQTGGAPVLLDEDRIDAALKLVMSSSPSYVLMASLDGARHMAALEGPEMIRRAAETAGLLKRQLSALPGIEVLEGAEGMQDILRVVFSARKYGIPGYELKDAIFDEAGISLEMADSENLVCVVTWANTGEDVQELVRTVEKILKERPVKKPSDRAGIRSGTLFLPETVLTPREAFFAGRKSVPLEEAAGYAAAESVIPYPPGIPLICPGERITEEAAEAAVLYREIGAVFHGVKDGSFRTVQVLAGTDRRTED